MQPSTVCSSNGREDTGIRANNGNGKSHPTPVTPSSGSPDGAAFGLSCPMGLAALLAANVGVYALAVWGDHASTVASWVLAASGQRWWQFASSAFVHASFAHLTRDLAVVWLAGSLARKELGSIGVWFAYVLSAVCANLSAVAFMPAKVKAAGGLLGLGATGGAAGLALTALVLGARPTPGFLLSAWLFCQLLLAPMLAVPVPGGPSAALPLPHSLAGLVFGGSLSDVAYSLRGTLAGAAADPGLTWLWGAGAAALLVSVMARVPDPESSTQS